MRFGVWRRHLTDRAPGWSGFKRFGKNEGGSTAIEFAMVSIPFFFLVFALFGFALYFFVMNSLDKGMDQSSRLLRTGQAQKANMTVNGFKQSVCNLAGGWIICPKVQVFVQKFPDWTSVAPTTCLNSNGSVNTNSASGTDQIAQYSGTASQIVIVTTCYKWEFAQKIPFLSLGNMSDGSLMMQTATAFRTEPYS
jgi:Flp pilus assembly protein TadG